MTAKCAIVRRNYAPGIHGPKGQTKKTTEYGNQLKEKQKAKKTYNLMEKQFKLTFEKSKKQKGNTSENFLKNLEIRLDNAVYRLGFADSRSQARELISHGHFLVNNKKVNIPSYSLRTGDVIKIKDSSKRKKPFNKLGEKLKKVDSLSWINLNIEELTGKILHSPSMKDIKINFDPQVIIEYYSR